MSNQMSEVKRLSLPQMPAVLGEQPILPSKCFFWSRSKSSHRVKSARSAFSFLKERPKEGAFDPDKLEVPRRARSSPTRSVSRMVEPFPLILPDKRFTVGGFESCSQAAPPKLTPKEDADNSIWRPNAPPITERSFLHSISANLCNSSTSRSAITFLDMGMFPPENKDFQAVYLQVQNEVPVPDCVDCPCSPSGSPCQEICIFEDYAGTQENPPVPVVGDVLSKRFSCSPGPEIDALCAPARVGISAFETEGSWLAGKTACSSWLDDSSSCGQQECGASQASYTQQKLLRGLSWVSDSSGSSSEEDSFPPSRPKLVYISSRPPSSEDVSALTPGSPARMPQPHSNGGPISSPTTPVNERTLGTDNDKTPMWDTSGRVDQSASQQTSGSPTPPTTPERACRPLTIMSKGVPRIISMLEDSAKTFPSTMLQPHTAPITLIRKIPSPHLPPLHLGRSGLPTRSASSSARPLLESKTLRQNTSVDEVAMGITIFRQIFSSNSDSADFLHTTLYAHILALNFLSDLVAAPFEYPPIQFPPKALSTLGAIEPIEGQGQLYDRIAKVSTALRMCVGRLLEACCGRSRLDETLLKALREIVKLVESRSRGRELF